MRISAGWRERRMLCRVVIACAMVFSGCTQVGPDFIRPEPQVMPQWLEADEAQLRTSPADYRMWWTAFRDPVLDHLVQIAYAQNIPLRVAGARVFEARARLGIAIGEQYPQVQQAVGSALDIRESERAPTAPQRKSPADQFEYKQAQVAAAASWEIDFWGKFRQAQNALCILLGMPPGNLDHLLGDRLTIPQAPLDVAVGIPADLLRRRPDIPSAELRAAAQSALIGVAKADLYPAFTLTGTFGFLASDVGRFGLGDIAAWSSRYGSFGPSFAWNILNYGQITNNVRVQDARFQELIFLYQDTVLRAQQEVEDALTGFLQSQKSLIDLAEAVTAAKLSANLAFIQYQSGATDYTTVISAQQFLLSDQDSLAVAQGAVPQGLIAVYRSLGGGWELREGKPFLPADITTAMGKRTDWGGLLEPAAVRPLDTRQLLTPDWWVEKFRGRIL